MVHVFCLNEKCRRVIHLANPKYWDFKGKVRCLHCGAEMEVEIEGGEIRHCRESEAK